MAVVPTGFPFDRGCIREKVLLCFWRMQWDTLCEPTKTWHVFLIQMNLEIPRLVGLSPVMSKLEMSDMEAAKVWMNRVKWVTLLLIKAMRPEGLVCNQARAYMDDGRSERFWWWNRRRYKIEVQAQTLSLLWGRKKSFQPVDCATQWLKKFYSLLRLNRNLFQISHPGYSIVQISMNPCALRSEMTHCGSQSFCELLRCSR